MERLTKADIDIFIKNTPVMLDRCVGKTVTAKILGEMLEYKTTEKELGIDLITLFKALKNGFYAITDKERKTIGFIQGGELYLRLCFQTKKIHTLGSNEDYYFDGYGKTWALTKEELENDK